VDLACGDVVHFSIRGKPRVLQHLQERRQVNIICQEGVKHFMVHHLILAVMDPENDLFEAVQRFTAFRGYWNRGKRAFTRPRDNCSELEEELDEDGDGLTGVCKTDGEHGLGCRFHNLWALWRSHHTVNIWFHLMRQKAGYWLHPYIKEKYGKKPEDRQYPSLHKKFAKTLTEEFYEL
jgi:hypothetical protein